MFGVPSSKLKLNGLMRELAASDGPGEGYGPIAAIRARIWAWDFSIARKFFCVVTCCSIGQDGLRYKP
jgi:hypothetical protein